MYLDLQISWMKYLCCAHCIIKNISDLRKIYVLLIVYQIHFSDLGASWMKYVQKTCTGHSRTKMWTMFCQCLTWWSLPPTSVMNEISFSAMKLTKGKRRTQLTYWISAFQDKRPDEFIWVMSFNLSIIKIQLKPCRLCKLGIFW